jgi:AraC-like DNA-binding protein/mannose-6-phosphate isomerase-like protein (cupin superfamily)
MKPAARDTPANLQLRFGDRSTLVKDVPSHSHAETELVAIRQGRCRMQVGDQVFEGATGTIFVLPATLPQYVETLEMTHTTYIGFDLPPGLFDESARVLTFKPADPAMQLVEQLCDSHRTIPPLSHDVTRAMLLALLLRLGDMDAATGSQVRLHPAVRLAQAHLEAKLPEPLTLAGVARKAGVSASHLSALFAAQCGVGPMRYLQRLRLERACWLLANPYLRIHEVAQACGYDDVNYFTRLFHRSLGMSPGRWRKKHLSNHRAVKKG